MCRSEAPVQERRSLGRDISILKNPTHFSSSEIVITVFMDTRIENRTRRGKSWSETKQRRLYLSAPCQHGRISRAHGTPLTPPREIKSASRAFMRNPGISADHSNDNIEESKLQCEIEVGNILDAVFIKSVPDVSWDVQEPELLPFLPLRLPFLNPGITSASFTLM